MQRYVNNPYLVNGLKFDFRIYVLITGRIPSEMQAFVADEGVTRFCTEKYFNAGPENLNNVFMHITNFSINRYSKNYVDCAKVYDILQPNNATKRTLKALFTEL